MRVLLINVSLRPESIEKLFPIGLGYVATAMKKAGYQFDLLDIDAHRFTDQEVEDYFSTNIYDVYCLGCIVTGYKIIKSMVALIRRINPQATIIVGNSVATSVHKILLTKTEVDIAVLGEGDEVVVEVLDHMLHSKPLNDIKGIAFTQNNQIVETGYRCPIKNISDLPFIDHSIFDVGIYLEASKVSVSDAVPFPREQARAMPVNTARGCVAKCGFCYHVFNNVPFRFRTEQSIVEEIKQLHDKYALNFVFFWDELTLFSKKRVKDICRELIDSKLNIYWTGTCRGDLLNKEEDLELVKLMKDAGCIGISYSLESADADILKAMNKHMDVDQFSRQTELFHKGDMNVWTSLVLGYPQETPETIKKTFDCCIKNGIYPSSGYLLPQPGSEVYEYALKNKYITDEEDYLMRLGDRQDLRINLTSMSDDEFLDAVLDNLKRCNRELNIGLDEEHLIKTQHRYRSTRDQSDEV